MTKVNINKHIVADPNICHGKPTFVGTRIMVWQVLEMLSSGATELEIVESFPALNKKHIKAALDYASSITKHANVVVNTEPPISAR
jgi:uncharacterized protein (DUF433 family)